MEDEATPLTRHPECGIWYPLSTFIWRFHMSRNKRVLSIALFLILTIILVASKSFSAQTAIFGPERFVREQGQPVRITKTFSVQDATSPFTIVIETGSGSQVVSSAMVELNGVMVAGPNAFNQTVLRISRSVQLQKVNTLTVEVRSAPGSSLSVTIFGQTQIRSVVDALNRLEANQQIPTLDRSTSLLGPDVDGNGVRDDIDRYVEGLPDTSLQKGSLRQMSKAIAQAMQSGGNGTSSDMRAASTAIGSAVHCIWDRYDAVSANNKVKTIKQLTVNTLTRLDAYERYNTSRSGSSSRLPRGDTCDTH